MIASKNSPRELESILTLEKNELVTVFHSNSLKGPSSDEFVFTAHEVYLQVIGTDAVIHFVVKLDQKPHLFGSDNIEWEATALYAMERYQIDLSQCYVVDHI